MDVDGEIQRGWAEHGTDAEGVAARFEALCEAASPGQVPAVASLVVHVTGEHLGRWAEGLAHLDHLARHGDTDLLHRCRATLWYCAGETEAAERSLAAAIASGGDPAGHEARVRAIASAAVAAHGRIGEAGAWLARAAELASGMPDADPAVRSVAITSNNLAVSLEQKVGRSAAEDQLLREAARQARVFWARAGTWVEVERAEYRLAMTHLALGEPATALEHASACASICDANGADAGEQFFALEVVCRAKWAAGDFEGARAACREAAGHLPAMNPGLAGYAAGVHGALAKLVGG